MTPLKSHLIDLYRFASWPLRTYRLRCMKRTGKVPVAILFFHRVDDQHQNPWTITETGFKQQVDWYQENFDLVDLGECQRRIRSGFNDRPTLSITFDDGYADNCEFALPMLIERGIPLTYFVTTDHTSLARPFPHDVDRNQPLEPNSIESLIALSAAGVEIGAHTRSHPDLGQISDPAILFDEVIAAAREMESLVDQKIRYFAFPFGQTENLNPAVFRLLQEHGFEGACSAYGGLNAIGDDAFHLQRLHGDSQFSRMKNWLTLDPRVRLKKQYDFLTAPEVAGKGPATADSNGNEPDPSVGTKLFPGTMPGSPVSDAERV